MDEFAEFLDFSSYAEDTNETDDPPSHQHQSLGSATTHNPIDPDETEDELVPETRPAPTSKTKPTKKPRGPKYNGNPRYEATKKRNDAKRLKKVGALQDCIDKITGESGVIQVLRDALAVRLIDEGAIDEIMGEVRKFMDGQVAVALDASLKKD